MLDHNRGSEVGVQRRFISKQVLSPSTTNENIEYLNKQCTAELIYALKLFRS